MEQEIKKLTKAVDKLARELKRYNDTKNAGPAGDPGRPGEPGKYMDPTQLPDVKVSLGQRNEGREFANMLARAMRQDDSELVRERMEDIAAALKAEQTKKYRSRGERS